MITLKKKTMLCALPMVALLLTACGDSSDPTDESKNTDEKTSTTIGSTDSTEQKDETTKNEVGSDDSIEAKDEKKDNQVGTDDSTESKDETTSNEVGTSTSELPYEEFSVDIEYPKGDYSLEYEKEFSGEKAELEDERKNTKITGEEALTNFKILVEKFTFDANTSDEDVKKQLFSIIKIDDDYKNIELDVKFANGTEKEYHFTK